MRHTDHPPRHEEARPPGMHALRGAGGAPTPGPPRGWNKPVRPLALLLVGAAVLLTWLAGTGWGVWYVHENWEARFAMRDQPVRLRLPAGMRAAADVASPIRTRIDLRPRIPVVVDQVMPVRITDSLFAQARVDTTLPIDTAIEVDTVVPIRTTLMTSVPIKSWLPRVPVSVPVTLDLPVRMRVPVRADVPVALDLDASGELPGTLEVPVRAAFILQPHVRSDLDVRLNATTLFSLTEAPAPIEARIARSQVRVPFNLAVRQRQLP